jgi:hypothetical protein
MNPKETAQVTAAKSPVVAGRYHPRPEHHVVENDENGEPRARRGDATDDVFDLTEAPDRVQDDRQAERGTGLLVVLVGRRGNPQDEYGRDVKVKYYRPPPATLPTQGEQPHPEQYEPEVEQHIRAHEVQHAEQPENAVLGADADPLQEKVVDHHRYQQTAEVDPLAAAQDRTHRWGKPLVVQESHESERVYKDFAENGPPSIIPGVLAC